MFAVFALTWCTSITALANDRLASSEVPNWIAILENHQEALDTMESDQSAKELYIRIIGPAMGLDDSAAAIGAKGIPKKLAADLMIPELAKSAQRLVASLTAWRLADRLLQATDEIDGKPTRALLAPQATLNWLSSSGSLPTLARLSPANEFEASSHRGTSESGPLVSISTAYQLSQEAAQQAMDEWWQLKTWKDRVRLVRGQSRLCGTWQWVIHNHQKHHQEQKLSLIFPPPGRPTLVQGLAEVVVLGDAVYLRWEADGHTQEDSLLFSNEGQRLEGTFVNSQGGWGAITGKRTATCTSQ